MMLEPSLKSIYKSDGFSETDREHAFFGYWTTYVEQATMLVRQDFEEMLTFPQWELPLGDVMAKICRQKKLRHEDINWLLEQLPLQSFSYRQVLAYQIVNNVQIMWEAKYQRLVDLKANWAISQLLSALSKDQIDAARSLIENSDLGRREKHWQLAILEEPK